MYYSHTADSDLDAHAAVVEVVQQLFGGCRKFEHLLIVEVWIRGVRNFLGFVLLFEVHLVLTVDILPAQVRGDHS